VNSDADFDPNRGYFAAINGEDLNVKVVGFDDGERVASKVFTLDPKQELVTFGSDFDGIDKVKFTARGGTDADPDDMVALHRLFLVDDLFLNF